tara:strand:- start:424 stop:1509 length:1086 start_codon:yes stop_codon:yes gene_type:complete
MMNTFLNKKFGEIINNHSKLLILSILTLVSSNQLFADHHESQKKNTSDFVGSFPLQGWWKFESELGAEKQIICYLFSWIDKETEIENFVDMRIDPSSREIEHITRVFQVPTKNPTIHNRLWVNNNGEYGQTTQVVKSNSMIATVVGSTPNGLLSAVIHTSWNDEKTKAERFMSNAIDGHTEFKTKTTTLFGKRISQNPIRNGEIKIRRKRQVNSDYLDERLNNLLGEWSRTDSKNNSKKTEIFSTLVKGGAILERFLYHKIEGNSESLNGGGYQLTVRDPSNGKLSMWFINKNRFFHAGYWQIKDDKTFIQNYLNRRYVREVINNAEMRAFFQKLENGNYLNQNPMIFKKTPETNDNVSRN